MRIEFVQHADPGATFIPDALDGAIGDCWVASPRQQQS